MKTIEIHQYRSSKIEETQLINLNVDIITELLNKRDLVNKEAGLCAPPWDKYYSFSYQDSRGVSHSQSSNINVCYITVNQATSTYSKTTCFYSITIVKTMDNYYVAANSQHSRYRNSIGAEHIVYECQENELNTVLDILFKYVK